MSKALPSYLLLQEPLYGSALATAQRALDTRTGTPAVVLRAPAATVECLTRAREALLLLRRRDAPPPGLPLPAVWGEEEDGGGFLALLELRGQSVQGRLAALEPLPERGLLALARYHAQVLAALHQAGFSGLRPWPAQVYWDDSQTPPWFTLLGWEWLVPGVEDAPGDLCAAAGLWIELATGAPPEPGLRVEGGPARWQSLSLGLRVLLEDLWRARRPATAADLVEQLSELGARWTAAPASLLTEARSQLPADPAAALMAVDLAQRLQPALAGAHEAGQAAQALLVDQVRSLIDQGRRDIALGQYSSAERILRRAGQAWQALPGEVLRAARWRAGALALGHAVQTDLSRHGLPVRDLERDLVRALELADSGEIDLAREALDAILGQLPPAVNLTELLAIDAELRAQQLWRQAQQAETGGDWAEAGRLYADLRAEQGNISYWPELADYLGDPAASEQAAQAALQRLRASERLFLEAQRRLQAGDPASASTLARQAASLSREAPQQLAASLALAQRAELRRQAVTAGVLAEVKDLTGSQQAAAVAALHILAGAFPNDDWAAAQGVRWRAALLGQLVADPAGNSGSLLYTLAPTDPDVLAGLQQAAPQALAAWQLRLDDLATQAAPGHPARLAQTGEQLAALNAALLAAEGWLNAAGAGEQASALRQQAAALADQVQARQAGQARLRHEFEDALALGLPTAGILAQAGELSLELYDDEERSLAVLRGLASQHTPGLALWQRTLTLADADWRSGNLERAGQAYRSVADDSEAPASARHYARLALDQVTDDVPAPEAMDTAAAHWQTRADDVLEQISQALAAPRPSGAPARSRPGRWWVMAGALLALLLVTLVALSLINANRIASSLAGLETAVAERAGVAPSPLPVGLAPAEGSDPSALEPVLSLAITYDVDGQPSDVARPGQILTFQVRIENSGASTAYDVALTCTSPAGVDPIVAGAREVNAGELTHKGLRIEPGQNVNTELVFVVSSDEPDGTGLLLECVASHAESVVAGSSSVVWLEQPEPILIMLLPDRLDLGVSESVDLMIRVTQGSAGTPITNTQLTIQVEPAALLAAAVDPVMTDQNGEAVVILQAGQSVGNGQMTVQLTESGEAYLAALIIRPTVFVPPSTNIRSEPSVSSAAILNVPDRSKPFTIIGQSETDPWWQIRLPDNTTAWVSKIGQGVETVGDVANVPIALPTSAESSGRDITRLLVYPSEALVGEDIVLSATLAANGEAVADEQVRFQIGADSIVTTTDEAGVAAAVYSATRPVQTDVTASSGDAVERARLRVYTEPQFPRTWRLTEPHHLFLQASNIVTAQNLIIQDLPAGFAVTFNSLGGRITPELLPVKARVWADDSLLTDLLDGAAFFKPDVSGQSVEVTQAEGNTVTARLSTGSNDFGVNVLEIDRLGERALVELWGWMERRYLETNGAVSNGVQGDAVP